MKNFDFYEFTGILCPGVVVLFPATLTDAQGVFMKPAAW